MKNVLILLMRRIFWIIIFLFCFPLFSNQQLYAAISPLIFGSNLTLNDANDQFITSAQTRTLLSQIHVQLIRMPIRNAGGPAPQEVTAMQDIKAMGAIPLIVLKYSQTDPTGAAKLVIQQANSIFGNSAVYYEFGNERDLAGVDQVAYTTLWNQTISQVKSLTPNGKFGGPTNFQTNAGYIAYFVEHANPQPDFISWHEYTCGNGADPQTVCIGHIANWKTHISTTKAAIQANPTNKTVPPIFITEWNYDPNNPNPDPRATAQFQQQFTQTALQELVNDGVTGAAHYVATGHQYYNLVDPNNTLTPEGQMFGQMYTQLIGSGGGPTTTPTINPTSQPSGSPSPSGTGTQLAITVYLHGVGSSGDNANPSSNGNTNPLHTTRAITFSILDNNNQPVGTGNGSLSFNQSSGNFSGIVTAGNIPNGSYLIQIKTQGFLSKQIPGIQTITNGAVTTIPPITEVNGDINNDNQLDISDYNLIVSCFGSKLQTSTCVNPPTQLTTGADINDDGKVDGIDYNLFLRELSVQKSSQ